MIPNEDLFRRVMQAFNRDYAGAPGSSHPRQNDQLDSGVQAVVELLVAEAIPFPKEPSEAMEWAFHNGVPVNARHNFLNRYRAMRAAAVHELAARPAPQDDVCTCPTCGDWYAAEDIDRMVKEISDALGSTATHPKLCDIVVETVRAIGPKAPPVGWKLVPVEPTAEILGAAAASVWPVASNDDLKLAAKAAMIVLKTSMDVMPGVTLMELAATIATMAPAYRAMIAAAPGLPRD